MDEMKIKLSTKIMRGIVARLLSKLIRDKLGPDIDIGLGELEIKTVDNNICIHANVDAVLTKDEFINILKKINLE